MRPDQRWLNPFGGYGVFQLMVPVGAMQNPMADFNFDAETAGWGAAQHSDHKDLPYHRIYDWYKRFLASPGAGAGSGPTAIPIGIE